jgi:hypothetical protein
MDRNNQGILIKMNNFLSIFNWGIQRFEQLANFIKNKKRRDCVNKIDKAITTNNADIANSVMRNIEAKRKSRTDSKD